MTEKEYETFVWSKWFNTAIQDLASRTELEISSYSEVHRTLNIMAFCMGLAGEAGEVVDLLKKHTAQGKEFAEAALVNELGDVEYYLQLIRSQFGITREECIEMNVKKLNARYPSRK